MDAGIHADEERLTGERYGSTPRALGVQTANSTVKRLRGEQRHLKVHDLLLLRWGRPGPISLCVASCGVERLMGQIIKKRSGIVRMKNFGCTGCRRRFPSIKHNRAQ